MPTLRGWVYSQRQSRTSAQVVLSQKPEHYRLIRRTVEATRRAKSKGSFTVTEWLELKSKHGYICLCCRKSESEVALHADHVIPISKGGPNTIANIQPLCQPCNSSKGTRTIDYR